MHPQIKSGSFPFIGKLFHLGSVETSVDATQIWGTKLYDGDDGLKLPPDAVVIDAGANVGIFSLYIQSLRADRRATVYAFEPIPAIFEALEANIRSRGAESHVRLFNIGLSDSDRIATFRFYKNASVLSSVNDRDDEMRAIAERQDVMELLRTHRPAVYYILRYMSFLRPLITKKIMHNLLAKEELECRVKTLSQVIAEQKIERIDFLKIDVEHSELPILNGIDAHDWPKIQRLVIECHKPDERPRIVELLRGQGFCIQEKPDVAEYCILYASRSPERAG